MMTNYKESLLAFTFLLIVHNSDKGFMGRGFVLLITVGSNIWKLLNIRLWKLLVTCGFWFNSPWLLSRWISNVFLRCFSTVLMFQYIIIHCLQNIKVLSVKECIPQSPGIQWWYDSGYRERHHSCELGLWFQWSFFFSFLTVFSQSSLSSFWANRGRICICCPVGESMHLTKKFLYDIVCEYTVVVNNLEDAHNV